MKRYSIDEVLNWCTSDNASQITQYETFTYREWTRQAVECTEDMRVMYLKADIPDWSAVPDKYAVIVIRVTTRAFEEGPTETDLSAEVYFKSTDRPSQGILRSWHDGHEVDTLVTHGILYWSDNTAECLDYDISDDSWLTTIPFKSDILAWLDKNGK